MKQYRYVLLDADQTLFDFNRAEEAALCGLLTGHSVLPEERLVRLYHEINASLWNVYEQGEISQDSLKVRRFELFIAKADLQGDPAEFAKEYMERLARQGVLFDGAADLVRDLSHRYDLALVTNGVGFIQHSRLEQSGLAPCFKAVIISGEIGIAKPDAGIVLAALSALGCQNPAEAVMVGDSLNADIGAGKNAGVDTVWFNPGERQSDLPTYTVRSYDDLRRMLLS